MQKLSKLNKHSFITSSRGMGTIEVVIIIAILVSLALIFRNSITNYANSVMTFVFDESKVIGSI